VRDKVKENGGTVLSMEGEGTGEWVLVDLGDMVVHIMQPAIRDYYRLEELWGDKEVKFGAAKRVKRDGAAAEEETPARRTRASATSRATQTVVDDDAPKKPARKTAARKTPAPTKPARKTTAKTPAGKLVKVAPTKSAGTRKTAAKRAPARKTTA
jgi:ribosome-associated protein